MLYVQDRVDSLEWAHSGCRFASGSRDGVAKVWRFSCGKWRPTPLIVAGYVSAGQFIVFQRPDDE